MVPGHYNEVLNVLKLDERKNTESKIKLKDGIHTVTVWTGKRHFEEQSEQLYSCYGDNGVEKT